MLVLSRMPDESVMLGDDVEVTVVEIRGNKARLGFTAPKSLSVHRKEVWLAIRQEQREVASGVQGAAVAPQPAVASLDGPDVARIQGEGGTVCGGR